MYKYLILLLLAFNLGIAQSVKYKSLVPTFDKMGPEELKNTLKEYLLNQDLDHPNANLRLALIYESNYKTADVLARYEYVLANAEEAKLGFVKVKRLIDEREVNRSNEFYFPMFKTFDAKGKPNVEFIIVSAKITQGIDTATLYLKKVPPIYKSFTQSVNFYDNAVKIFSEINNDFISLADVYLFHDEGLEKKLVQLKQNYDSTRFYFERYMELTKAFPIPYHKQKYHIKPIVTYRLDGLITRMNFLTNDVEFWNYGDWVDRVHKSLSGEILSLRSQLSQNEVKLSGNLKVIEASNGDGMTILAPDKQLVFNLNNFDKQSLALSLLEYKAFKQDWLLKTKTFIPDTFNLERNATIFSALIYSNKTADTLINKVKARATKEKIRKHSDFIGEHYGGPEGLQKYVNGEIENIRVTYELYSGGLRSALLNMVTRPEVSGGEKLIRFGRVNISTAVHAVTPELLAKGEPITLQTRRSPDGSLYLAGIYQPDKKTNASVTFVARVNADGKPGWVQNFGFKVDSLATAMDAQNYLGPFELTQEGCAFMVRSVHLSKPSVRNSLVYLNEKGEQKFLVRLPERAFARKISFTEKSNSFVLLFKGEAEKPNYEVSENLTLVGVNALGDILWRRRLGMAGMVTDLINLMDGHMVIGNYASLKDLHGKEHKTKPGETNPFLVKISAQGNIERVHLIPTVKPVFITHVVKVTDKSINLLGKEGNMEATLGKTISPDDEFVHIMSNRFCEVVCTNLPK